MRPSGLFDKPAVVQYHAARMKRQKKVPIRRKWVFLAAVALLIVGCQSDVQVTSRPTITNAWQATATRQATPHDLTLVAIDFDPPLDHLEWAIGRGVTLIVAVQNNGHNVERQVPIVARLFDGDAPPGDRILLAESTALLDTISPGEIVVVPFDRMTAVPLRMRYILEVQIQSVPGEAGLIDNGQVFEITIRPTPTVDQVTSD